MSKFLVRRRSRAIALAIVGIAGASEVAAQPAPTPDPAVDPTAAPAPAPTPEEARPATPEDALPDESARKMMREEIDKAHKPFEFHGYFRSGFGFNGKGGDQEAFAAPNAGGRAGPTKYRLGNETETYGEAILVNNWLRPEGRSKDLFFKTQLMLAFVTRNDANFDSAGDQFTIREAYAQAGGVIKAHPEMKFWAGQRYYHRHDTHIHDFFYLSMSGYGGGFEDLKLGSGKAGKLAIGYFGASVTDDGDLLDIGRPVKHVVDVRLEDAKVPGGEATFWAAGSIMPGGTVVTPPGDPPGGERDTTAGFAVGAIHTIPKIGGGFNKAVIQFGTGPLLEYDVFYRLASDALPAAPGLPGGTSVKDSWRLRLVEAFVLQPSPQISMMATAVYQLTDYGVDGDSREHWFSAGIRPIYHFTDHLTLAAELGVDVVNAGDALDTDPGPANSLPSSYLTHFTIAPSIQADRTFFGRPVLRIYGTLSTWGEDYEGVVARLAYGDDRFGFAFGIQAENWW